MVLWKKIDEYLVPNESPVTKICENTAKETCIMKQIKKIGQGVAAAAVAMGLVLGTNVANAVPILISDNNVGIRILGLEVPGGDPRGYNIDFEFDEWPEVYGGPTPTFDFDTPELAQAANEAINFVLNGANVGGEKVKQVGPPQEGQANEGFPLYAIGVSFDDPYVNWIGAAFVDNIDVWIDDFLTIPVAGAQDPEQAWMWAKATVVPVPAAVWLFGSGLLGLIGVARRKKAA